MKFGIELESGNISSAIKSGQNVRKNSLIILFLTESLAVVGRRKYNQLTLAFRLK